MRSPRSKARLRQRNREGSLFIELAAAATCAFADDSAAAPVRAARDAFNRAIAEKNVEAIAGVLADDVILVSGTDSDIFTGRAAQVDLWRSNFEGKDRLVYVRTPECVSLSPLYPIATETGTWRGAPEKGGGDFVGGTYAAKWRFVENRWTLEAETFATMNCGGALCPKAEAQK